MRHALLFEQVELFVVYYLRDVNDDADDDYHSNCMA